MVRGKTTLINTLMGCIAPTRGTVRIMGEIPTIYSANVWLDDKTVFVKGGSDNIKVEVFARLDIKGKKFVEKFLKFKHYYGDTRIFYAKEWIKQEYDYGNNASGGGSGNDYYYSAVYAEKVEKVFTLFPGEQGGHIALDGYSSTYYMKDVMAMFEKMQPEFFFLVTTKEGVTAQLVSIPEGVPHPDGKE